MCSEKNFDINRITTLLFDNDGIFVETEELYFKANQKVLSEIGVELTKEFYIEYSLTKGQGFDDLLSEEMKEKYSTLDLRSKRNEIYLELIKENLVVLDYAEEVLDRLKNSGKFKIGIVTSSRRKMFQAIHAQTGFLKYVDFVIDREDVKNSKPNPEPYLKALKMADSVASEALVIEDSERGLKSAVNAGISCITIPTELTKNQDFSKAVKVLRNLKELLVFLELE